VFSLRGTEKNCLTCAEISSMEELAGLRRRILSREGRLRAECCGCASKIRPDRHTGEHADLRPSGSLVEYYRSRGIRMNVIAVHLRRRFYYEARAAVNVRAAVRRDPEYFHLSAKAAYACGSAYAAAKAGMLGLTARHQLAEGSAEKGVPCDTPSARDQ